MIPECPACLEEWGCTRSPKLLRCGHNICAVCIRKTRTCPTCRSGISGDVLFDTAYADLVIAMPCGARCTFAEYHDNEDHVCQRDLESYVLANDPTCAQKFIFNHERPCFAIITAAFREDCDKAVESLIDCGLVVNTNEYWVELAILHKAWKVLGVLNKDYAPLVKSCLKRAGHEAIFNARYKPNPDPCVREVKNEPEPYREMKLHLM